MKTSQSTGASGLSADDLSNLNLERATKLARERGMAARADLFREMFRYGIASVRTLFNAPKPHGTSATCADCA